MPRKYEKNTEEEKAEFDSFIADLVELAEVDEPIIRFLEAVRDNRFEDSDFRFRTAIENYPSQRYNSESTEPLTRYEKALCILDDLLEFGLPEELYESLEDLIFTEKLVAYYIEEDGPEFYIRAQPR